MKIVIAHGVGFSQEPLARMAALAQVRTAFLINQARGRVVNEEALVDALKHGRIGGYATDVYAKEPPDPASKLFTFRNMVVTPHLGGGTRGSRLRACATIAEDAICVIRGEVPKNLVNREVLAWILPEGSAKNPGLPV